MKLAITAQSTPFQRQLSAKIRARAPGRPVWKKFNQFLLPLYKAHRPNGRLHSCNGSARSLSHFQVNLLRSRSSLPRLFPLFSLRLRFLRPQRRLFRRMRGKNSVRSERGPPSRVSLIHWATCRSRSVVAPLFLYIREARAEIKAVHCLLSGEGWPTSFSISIQSPFGCRNAAPRTDEQTLRKKAS